LHGNTALYGDNLESSPSGQANKNRVPDNTIKLYALRSLRCVGGMGAIVRVLTEGWKESSRLSLCLLSFGHFEWFAIMGCIITAYPPGLEGGGNREGETRTCRERGQAEGRSRGDARCQAMP
jgi:hypothetical protein